MHALRRLRAAVPALALVAAALLCGPSARAAKKGSVCDIAEKVASFVQKVREEASQLRFVPYEKHFLPGGRTGLPSALEAAKKSGQGVYAHTREAINSVEKHVLDQIDELMARHACVPLGTEHMILCKGNKTIGAAVNNTVSTAAKDRVRETTYFRIELSSGNVHSHPTVPENYISKGYAAEMRLLSNCKDPVTLPF